MSTIKSSAEDLTLNADGSGNDIIFQSNGSNVATLDQAGLLTATSFALDNDSATINLGADGDVTLTHLADNGLEIDAGSGVSARNTLLRLKGANDGTSTLQFADAADNNVGMFQYNHTSNYLKINVNDAEKLRILDSGGITFNGDTAAANALDDYEEGSWTPIFTASSSYSGQVYGTQEGSYTKVGRLVTATCYLTLSTEGSFSGTLFMAGFPFNQTTSISGGYGVGTINRVEQWIIGTNNTLGFHLNTNYGTFTIFNGNSSANSHGTLTASSALTNISSLMMTVTYMT